MSMGRRIAREIKNGIERKQVRYSNNLIPYFFILDPTLLFK